MYSLQRRLETTERKISVSEITIKRVAKERDQLAAQVELTLHDNDQLREDITELREELAILRQAIYGMERRPTPAPPKRVVSEPTRVDLTHNRDGTTQLEINRRRAGTAKATERRASASPAKQDLFEAVEPADPTQTENETQVDRDLTELSYMDPEVLAQLRKKLEVDHKNRHERPVMPRKSSLKDITAGLENAATGQQRRFSLAGGAEEETLAKTAKTVRVQSPHTSDASFLPQQQQQQQSETGDAGDTSMLSNTSRRRQRHRAASVEGMTSAFILPDITLHGEKIASSALASGCLHHASATCTACHPLSASIAIPTPTPVSERMPEDIDATLRPAEAPTLALATVIKNLEDEITHLKIRLSGYQQGYLRHDPSLGMRERVRIKGVVEGLVAEIERRSGQVYRLYDVLEGQRHRQREEEEGEGQSGAGAKRYGGVERGQEEEELPFEGLSEDEDDEQGGF
ncbi:hypothetical protein LTR65_005141 [Meristemomyces frigidus]